MQNLKPVQIANTVLGVPYFIYSIMGPKALFLLFIQARRENSPNEASTCCCQCAGRYLYHLYLASSLFTTALCHYRFSCVYRYSRLEL